MSPMEDSTTQQQDESTKNLPESGEWYKRTVVKMNGNHQMFRRSSMCQVMKVAGPFTLHEHWLTREKFNPPLENVYSIVLRSKRIHGKWRGQWKNLHVYSYDWPVFNNPKVTQENPESMIIFTKEERNGT